MRNTAYCAGVIITVLSLSACKGGGGSGGGSDQTNNTGDVSPSSTQSCVDNTATIGVFSSYCTTSFNEASAEFISNKSEFKVQNVTVQDSWSGAGYAITSNAYSDINLQYARSLGLTGAGQTIALVDEGFLLSHNDLSDKNITVYGKNTVKDHGTFVATIAAGDEDGDGVMGVASGADLHLTSLDGGASSVSDTAHLAAATQDAVSKGAIVQNNSWGYVFLADESSITLSHYNAWAGFNPGLSSAELFANFFGESAPDWENYISALDQFGNNGVVVFSQSNDENDTSSSLMAALPEIFPELKGSWVVAVNGLPEYNSSGGISKVHRLSAGCLETAEYCLTANGSTYGGISASNNSYDKGTGTSFAAPQISGSVALLAEAFPSLPASDLLNRLFASANNSFFTATDSVDFGNGITHGYSEEFGHGFVDLKAALLPIGNIGVPVTNNAYDGIAPLSEVNITSGSAHGDAFSSALSGKTMAIYDSLGANFTISADTIIKASTEDFGARLTKFQSDRSARTSAPMSYSFMGNELATETGGFQFVSGNIAEVGEELGFLRSSNGLFSGTSSVVPDTPDTIAFATVSKSDGHGFSAMTFVERSSDSVVSAGFGLSAARAVTPNLTGVIGFVANGETESALGLTAESQQDESLSAASSAFTFAGEWTYRKGLSFYANAELGLTVASGAGYIESFDPALHSAFSVGAKIEGVFSKEDRITLSLRQPLRIEQGNGTIRLPSGRLADGTITYANHQVDMQPSARQLDLGLRYDIGHIQNIVLGFGSVLSVNKGHIKGNLDATAMMSLKHRF
ncbi:S8 family peptidase [Pseudovibrio sp. Ad26]|uniref:S8 family peptidase n=1 Tax=Pseudovibrio sp. Ad26 TaxID=989410 RepID=UPI0007AE881F|nr:S8 family peptidase [Pseudovibrio sp. Ad26]KZL11529.1 Extracellular serine protease precursor [Pseudovibrio sp. Ad26]